MRSILFDEINSPRSGKAQGAPGEKPGGLQPAGCLLGWSCPRICFPRSSTSTQKCCGPHRVAVVLEEDGLKCELLVRSKSSLRCECTTYTTGQQRDFILAWAERLAEELGIRT